MILFSANAYSEFTAYTLYFLYNSPQGSRMVRERN